MKEVALVTGANRGLGLEFTRQLIEADTYVIAACRHPQEALALLDLKQNYPDFLFLAKLDVASPDSIEKACSEIGNQFGHIDLLINNVGIFGYSIANEYSDQTNDLGNLVFESLSKMFQVNAVAPAILIHRLLPLLQKSLSAKVVNISSGYGSIEMKSTSDHLGYCASKAALNMITKTISFYLRDWDIPIVSISPGWVRTDMGGKDADLSPEESVSEQIQFIRNINMEHSGGFFKRDGYPLPW